MVSLETASNGKAKGYLAGLDPRGKMIAAFGFSLLTALAQNTRTAGLCLAIGLVLTLVSRLQPRLVLRRAVAVNAFVLFLWLLLPWQINIGQASQASLLSFHPQGLELAWLITLKVNAVFLALLALLGTSDVNDLLHAMAHMKVPGKLVTLFLLFYRYIHVMRDELGRLRQAMVIRGFQPGNNAHTYRSYANLVGMLLVRSFDRSERVYQAMLLRGFDGTFWLMDHFHWHRRDNGFVALTVIGLACVAFMEWGV